MEALRRLGKLIPPLVGLKEAAKILGWDKRKVATYRRRGAFPEPIQTLSSGPVWTFKQIIDFKEEKEMSKMVKVVEFIEEKHDYPFMGESYTVGKTEDGRYFFSWGADYPVEDEVPAHDIEDGESGISYHDTADEALSAMQDAVDAGEDTRP